MPKSILAFIPFLVWTTGCGEQPEPAAPAQSQPMVVSTAGVTAQQWPAIYEASGTVRARVSGVIAAKWMGYVREVKVNVGDRVREGQLLVALDTRDLDTSTNRATAARDEVRNGIPEADSAMAAAKANLDLAQVTFKRINELYEKKSVSDQEFDEATARLKASQAAYEMARAKRTQIDARLAQADQEVRAAQVVRSYAEVQAPFSGIVTVKSVEPGNLAAPGAPLLTIEGEGYRLEAAVEESRLPSIRNGQPVTVALDGLNRDFAARVSEIVPSVDAATRTYIVKVDLPGDSAIRSGMFGRARFQMGMRQVLTVPLAAVNERGQLQSVFVADNGTARARLVTLGDRRAKAKEPEQAEVLSGLNAGENVIVPIPQGLADGTRIEVKP